MLRRTLVAVAIAAGTLVASALPAQAIPPNPLTVTSYYSNPDRTDLVGQDWRGCNQPSGQWGSTTSYWTITFVAC